MSLASVAASRRRKSGRTRHRWRLSSTLAPQHRMLAGAWAARRSTVTRVATRAVKLTKKRDSLLERNGRGLSTEQLEDMGEPRGSASVVLLRRRAQPGGAGAYEVLLAQRSSKMKSFSSAYVFPGGVTEPLEDALVAKQFSGSQAPSQEEVAKVTGIRELFEEAGVLLAQGEPKHHARAVFMPKDQQASWQRKVHDDAKTFNDLLASVGKAPALEGLHYWVTFITPKIEQRRFRTDFFVSVVDDCQVNLDGGETVHYIWITPAEALAQNRAGKMAMLPPQFYVLSSLAAIDDVDAVIKHGMDRPRRLPILPHAIGVNDERELVLVYPGDELHPEYTGSEGERRRICCTMPLGRGSYRFETNLAEEPSVESWRRRAAHTSSL